MNIIIEKHADATNIMAINDTQETRHRQKLTPHCRPREQPWLFKVRPKE